MNQAAHVPSNYTAQPEYDPWPRGVSRKAYMSIGKVVDKVKHEFPALTVSKLRYLEDQGLISPQRSATGYRKYSDADVERLRYCLIQQRDSYLPLQAILEQLRILDAGEDEVAPAPVARVVASEGQIVAPTNGRITVRELEDLTSCDHDFLDDIVKAGIITPDLSGRFPARAATIVTVLMAMNDEGVSIRRLPFVRMAAERQADLADQSAGGIANARGVNKERVHQRASEVGELVIRLNSELTRLYLDNLH